MKTVYKDYIRWKNGMMQKLWLDSRKHGNAFRYGDNETDEHCVGKWHVIDYYTKKYGIKNIEFLTECYSACKEFRADVIMFLKDAHTAIIVEIAVNETRESLLDKKEFWEEQGFDFEVRDHRGTVCKIE